MIEKTGSKLVTCNLLISISFLTNSRVNFKRLYTCSRCVKEGSEAPPKKRKMDEADNKTLATDE